MVGGEARDDLPVQQGFRSADGNSGSRVAGTRRRIAAWIVGACVAVGALYGLRVLWLWMMASEGDIPAASAVPLPDGAEIVGETESCGSGGCWLALEVRPPPGQTPAGLAEALGATPQLRIGGNVLDPRTVNVWAEPGDRILELQLDYFSSEWVP